MRKVYLTYYYIIEGVEESQNHIDNKEALCFLVGLNNLLFL